MIDVATHPFTSPQDLEDILCAVFAAWSQAGIPFVVLRNYETLPHSTENDLDILIPASRVKDAERLLLDTTARQGWRLWNRVEFSPISFWFLNSSCPHLLHIDLFVSLQWRGVEFHPASLVICRRKRGVLFDTPHPVDEAVINLLTSLLYQGYVKEKYRSAIQQTFEANCPEFVNILTAQFGTTPAERLAESMRHNNWGAVEAQAKRLQAALLLRYLTRRPAAFLRALGRDAVRIAHRLRRPPGGIVALVGPDGVGKSHVIQEVRKQLDEDRLFNRTVVRHWRPGVLPPLSRLLGGPPVGQDGPVPPRREPGRYRGLRLAYYGLDFCLGYVLRDLPQSSRLRLVLYDRCALDMAVDPLRYGLPTAAGARFMWRRIPKPDLVIFLHDTSERIVARKDELETGEVDRQLRAWLQFAESGEVGAIVHVDDVPEAIASRVKDVILEALGRAGGPPGALGHASKKAVPSAPFTPTNGSPRHRAQRYGQLALKDGREYLIPLGSRTAAASALTLYNAQNKRARCVRGLLSVALRLGLTQPFVRKVWLSDASRALSGHAGDVPLLEHLQQVVGLREVHFAISLGTPGPYRKPVLQILRPDGSIVGYAKVGWNEATNVLVRNEVDALRRLGAAPWRSCTLPSVLHAGWWRGQFLSVQSPPCGRTAVAPATLTPSYLAIQDELAALHTRWMRLRESAFWASLRQRVDETTNAYYRHILQKGLSRVDAWLGYEDLPFHDSHGDFAPWNARMANGRMLLFDWEYATRESFPGYDLFHFTVQTARHLKKWSPGRTFTGIQRDASVRRDLTGFLRTLGLSGLEVRPLLLLYVLERLAFYASEPEPSRDALRYFAHLANLLILKEPSIPCPSC